jgi:hypothetical protein
MHFVTIKESHNVADLLVVKSRLEAEGFNCILKNELTTQIMNYMPSFTVELQVPEDELEKVMELLSEWEK